jgi:hypothetical protein
MAQFQPAYLQYSLEYSYHSFFNGPDETRVDTLFVPAIQRPYQYDTTRTTSLVSAIIRGFLNRAAQPSYCMGSIVLCQKPNSRDYDIIDGKQRLVTITLLLAKLAQLSTDNDTNEYIHTLFQRNIAAEAISLGGNQYHLHLGTHYPIYQQIFDEYVHAPGGLNLLAEAAPQHSTQSLPDRFIRRLNSNGSCIEDLLGVVNPNQ